MLTTVALASAVLGLALAPAVYSQTSDAVCDPSFDWAKNPEGKTPCEVGASLLALCSETKTWVVPKLSPGNTYRAPNSTETNQCQCSSVTFSLLAACALCQNAKPITFTSWKASCIPTDVTIMKFPFTNNTTPIPLWSMANTTSDGHFDLAEAKRLAGVDEPDDSAAWPVRDIVLVSLGIASAMFLVFLAIFCFFRHRRVVRYAKAHRKNRSGKGGSYAPIEQKQKHGRVKSAHPGVYNLDLDARTASYDTNTAGYGAYDDPFGAQERERGGERDRANDPMLPAPAPTHQRQLSGPYGDSKPYVGAGPSTTSLSTTGSRIHPSDNMLKHPASSSTVNVIHRERDSDPPRPSSSRNVASQPQPSPSALQTTFGSHPAHHREESSSSLASITRPTHQSRGSSSSQRGERERGWDQGPSPSLFSRKKQIANKRKDTDFSIEGTRSNGTSSSNRLSSDSSYSLIPTPTSQHGVAGGIPNHFTPQQARSGAASDGATLSPSDATTLVHPNSAMSPTYANADPMPDALSPATHVHPGPAKYVPLVQVTAPSTASGTLVSHYGRIEHAGSSSVSRRTSRDTDLERERWEELPRPTGERDPFATLRELAMADPEPDIRTEEETLASTGAGAWRRRDSERDMFGDDYQRR